MHPPCRARGPDGRPERLGWRLPRDGGCTIPIHPPTLDRNLAARLLVGHTGLARPEVQTGAEGVRSMLAARRCVQLDPLDPIGTNADLVALARVDGLVRGDVYSALLPGHAFEHFAKERCLIPAAAFPHYRDHAHETAWWRDGERLSRLGPGLLEDVLAEVAEVGPVAVSDLTDRGRVAPLDWSGWKGTGKATSMAVEVLWRRCQVVVCGRAGRSKVIDVPRRALALVADLLVEEPFAEWALRDRAEAAVLLSRSGGAFWSALDPVRRSPVPDTLVARGLLQELRVEGSPRTYLAPPDLLDRPLPEPDDRLRILGPLDPVMWDRKLVQAAFGFDYVWEVYKPAGVRRWGWYVCPLLHRGALVGRIEARAAGGQLVVDRLWREAPSFDDEALERTLAAHAVALGLTGVVREAGAC